MNKLDAYKMDGLGNDFIIFDKRKKSISLTKDQIVKISDRNSIGCDQVIFIDKDKVSDAYLTFYNSNGEEVSACGNGSRCVAFLLMKEFKTKKITIQTEVTLLNAFLTKNNQVSVDIGKAYFKWNEIPLKRKINIEEIDFKIDSFFKPFVVNVGNPHIVFFVENLKKINLKKLGPKIEKLSLFPERINVNFAKILNNNKIELRVWERGSGITKACGTGASATTVAAIKNKLINKRMCHIHMEGGKLKIEYKKNGHIVMTGPIKIIKKGVLNNFF